MYLKFSISNMFMFKVLVVIAVCAAVNAGYIGYADAGYGGLQGYSDGYSGGYQGADDGHADYYVTITLFISYK